MEESSKRAAKTVASPCRKHVGGYTAGVCVNTNICLTHALQRVARSRIVLSLFLQPIISYRVRLHDDFDYFQFPESHKIFFCWDADVRPKSEIHLISVFKNFEFPVPKTMSCGTEIQDF